MTWIRDGGVRLAQSALVIAIALTLNFALPRLTPGDPLNYLFGADVNALTPAQKQQIYEGNARRVYPRLDAALKKRGT